MQRTQMSQKKQISHNSEATHETLKSMPSQMVKPFTDIGAGIGRGLMDAVFGTDYSTHEAPTEHVDKRHENKVHNFHRTGKYETLYNFSAEQEKRTIKELMKKIDEQIMAFKQQSSSLAEKIKDAENVTINSAPEKPGIYHIRFLELMLDYMKSINLDLGKGNTWFDAMSSKKAKRGSAFAARSKKSGTQYSQSEEMKMTRSKQ